MAFIRSSVEGGADEHAQGDRVGEWVGTCSSLHAVSVPTDVPCPYCRRSLTARVSARMERIVQVLSVNADGSREIVAVTIPETHQLLRCLPCDARFVGEKP